MPYFVITILTSCAPALQRKHTSQRPSSKVALSYSWGVVRRKVRNHKPQKESSSEGKSKCCADAVLVPVNDAPQNDDLDQGSAPQPALKQSFCFSVAVCALCSRKTASLFFTAPSCALALRLPRCACCAPYARSVRHYGHSPPDIQPINFCWLYLPLCCVSRFGPKLG